MVRTQIYLTEDEQQRLGSLARRVGRKRSALIRDALDEFLTRAALEPRTSRIRSCRGIWRDRPEAECHGVRAELERRLGR